jgi:hypothetical protein
MHQSVMVQTGRSGKWWRWRWECLSLIKTVAALFKFVVQGLSMGEYVAGTLIPL